MAGTNSRSLLLRVLRSPVPLPCEGNGIGNRGSPRTPFSGCLCPAPSLWTSPPMAPTCDGLATASRGACSRVPPQPAPPGSKAAACLPCYVPSWKEPHAGVISREPRGEGGARGKAAQTVTVTGVETTAGGGELGLNSQREARWDSRQRAEQQSEGPWARRRGWGLSRRRLRCRGPARKFPIGGTMTFHSKLQKSNHRAGSCRVDPTAYP